jgi:hypothetical protein
MSHTLNRAASRTRVLLTSLSILILAPLVAAQPSETVLFIGNSFTFGSGSPVRTYRPQSVTDLNKEGVGGVALPAFSQAGLHFTVASNHCGAGSIVISRQGGSLEAPDHVVMHGFQHARSAEPGNPDLLVRTTKPDGRAAARSTES